MSDIDSLFKTLADEHRRRVLASLCDEEALRVPEDVRTRGQNRRKLEIELYHKDLPRLDNEGYVEWNRADRSVTRGPRFAEIKPLVSLLSDHAETVPEEWP